MNALRTWPPPAVRATLSPRARRLPFPLAEPGVRLYAQARQALRRCLPALGLRPGDEVLVPEYHHGSEVEALRSAGLVVRPYAVHADLRPVGRSVTALVGPRTRALHLVHHLGFPQDAARWRRWCDELGLLLLEDAAQAWLAERDGLPVGVHGDLAVFCLYKSVGLPDGAAVTARVPLPGPERAGVVGARYLAAPVVRAALARVGRLPGPQDYDQARDLAVPRVTRAPALASRWLVGRCRLQDVAAARRRAYTRLLEDLGSLVVPAFAELPAGASPFAFPLAVDDKADALSRLQAAGIDGLDLWSRAHPALPERPGSYAAWLRAHVVCLPVHQDLGDGDLETLVRAARPLRGASRPQQHRAS